MRKTKAETLIFIQKCIKKLEIEDIKVLKYKNSKN